MAARKKTSSQPKPRYHHGDLRRALIDASLALIAEEGFSALTLREVARRAGVTHAAPYRHFADKEALLAAVAEEGFRAMASDMRERMDKETSPTERLLACGVAYVLFAVRHPSHFRVMFGPHFTQPSEHEDLSRRAPIPSGCLMQRHHPGPAGGRAAPGRAPCPLALTCLVPGARPGLAAGGSAARAPRASSTVRRRGARHRPDPSVVARGCAGAAAERLTAAPGSATVRSAMVSAPTGI